MKFTATYPHPAYGDLTLIGEIYKADHECGTGDYAVIESAFDEDGNDWMCWDNGRPVFLALAWIKQAEDHLLYNGQEYRQQKPNAAALGLQQKAA